MTRPELQKDANGLWPGQQHPLDIPDFLRRTYRGRNDTGVTRESRDEEKEKAADSQGISNAPTGPDQLVAQ